MQSGRADQNSAFENLNRVGARAVWIHCGSSRERLIRDVAIQTPGLSTRDVSRSVLREYTGGCDRADRWYGSGRTKSPLSRTGDFCTSGMDAGGDNKHREHHEHQKLRGFS
jgi:hypothetical protein